MSPRTRPRPRTRARGATIAVIATVLVLVVCGIGVGAVALSSWLSTVTAQAPMVGTVVLAPPASGAAQAAAGDGMTAEQTAAADYLAAQPTAYWLTPEQDPIGTVGDTVTSLAADARTQDAALALVVYGLPERDCGNHSAGGLSESDYPRWVTEIATALRTASDVQKIVVLEPDSLALAPECGNVDDRVRQLSAAASALAGPDTWTYVDGGHSNWLSAAEMAGLIGRVGDADTIRGFATNVSNYNATYDEFAYAHELSALTGGLHALIDTSRNGAASAGGDWCNPPDQRVGEPGGTFGDDVVDTNLWIKPPGESDGACNGGPDAGEFWPEAAAALTAEVR